MRFKITTLFLFSIIFSGIAQTDTLIKNGKISLAILKIDFDSYTFEGGDMMYPDCINCTADSFEFTTIFNPPMDFGDITFTTGSLQDTVFNGTIIWMGTGSISTPQAFETGEPYTTTTTEITELPINARFLNYDGLPLADSSLIDSAKHAWNSIFDRSIISTYGNYVYQPVFYLYAPTVGTFDPSVAKWIIFLYTFQEASTAELSELTEKPVLFPNPVYDILHIQGIEHPMKYTILDMNGKIVQEGTTNQQPLYVNGLKTGNYELLLMLPGSTQIIYRYHISKQ